jgi:transcriptional regulator with XRE-family HTH domain
MEGALPAVVIGQVLREARRRRGLTQQQLADPFSTAFVCSVELGNTMPSLSSLAILLERLGMSLAEFFGEVERRTVEFAQAAGRG